MSLDYDREGDEEAETNTLDAGDLQDMNVSFYYDDVFEAELDTFKAVWERLLGVYQPLEVAVVTLGVLGNSLAFLTLLNSRKMHTPSFHYHRTLVGVNLLFAVNYFAYYFNDRFSTVQCNQQVFKYWSAAFFAATVNPTLNNVTGYLILYMTLAIAFDRFVALLICKRYQWWNRSAVAYVLIAVAVCLSTAVHSWPCFLQHLVVEYRLGVDRDPLIRTPCWTESVVYFWIRRDLYGDLQRAVHLRNIYNRVARVVYPLCLALLTFSVIAALLKRRRRRCKKRLVGASYSGYNNECSITVSGVTTTTTGHERKHRKRTKDRYEKCLFILMIAVVVLTFVQVAAGETRRLLQLTFPAEDTLHTKVADETLTLSDRLWYFRLLLYGHQSTRILSNFCTVINRSLICILYVAMNKLFRRELRYLLKLCFAAVCNLISKCRLQS